jgi:spore maturation protein CgeB
MMPPGWNIVMLGLSMTSSWGNGHATTYRSLCRALTRRGHHVTFLERDAPWYSENRDMHSMRSVDISIYDSVEMLQRLHARTVAAADLVIMGSFVPEGRRVGAWVRRTARGLVAFYDIDTPITLAALETDRCEYVARAQLATYDLYLSFTSGPSLVRLAELGAPVVRPLYCAIDPAQHRPVKSQEPRWDLGYLGTYAADRQPALEELLISVARRCPDRRFIVAGPLYPPEIEWPTNVERRPHVAPAEHSAFYAAQRFTLNLTRDEMKRAGYSPSVRLFEAAACGAVIITDTWPGLGEFFDRGREILPVDSSRQVEHLLSNGADIEQLDVGARARSRVLACHTAEHRAVELERYVNEIHAARANLVRRPAQTSRRAARLIAPDEGGTIAPRDVAS